jgi:hypothetical protein
MNDQNISKYIKVYDNVVSKNFCDHMISKFKSHESLQIKRKEHLYVFNEINLSQHENFFDKEIDFLFNVFSGTIEKYKFDCNIHNYQFPRQYGFEQIRMKQYLAGNGEFKPHVDSICLASSPRFLVFFLYLDEGEGGGTALFDQNFICERKIGRMIMFPPTWTYPHAGLMPKNNDKYILGSYLQFSS